MTIYKKFRKTIPKVRKGIKSAAKTYLNIVRSGAVKNYRKTGKWSSTAIAKSLSNLRSRVNTVAEYKTLTEQHTTGDPDVNLRQYYRITASSVKSTPSTTSTPGTAGYFLEQIDHPTRGDGLTNFDGKRFNVSSLQWKGTVYSGSAGITARMMIVRYDDEDMDPFQMSEFMNVDNNGEYSVACRKNSDYKNYKIIASRTIKLAAGGTQRKDFNIFVKPNHVVRINESDDSIYSHRYFCVILVSSDIASIASTTQLDYHGFTRMRFIA